MRGTKIGDNVVINYGMIDENVKIEDGAVIGDENSDKYNIALVGRNQIISKNSKIKSGEVIESL
jgi:ADP-glucose pyrophosphorylase